MASRDVSGRRPPARTSDAPRRAPGRATSRRRARSRRASHRPWRPRAGASHRKPRADSTSAAVAMRKALYAWGRAFRTCWRLRCRGAAPCRRRAVPGRSSSPGARSATTATTSTSRPTARGSLAPSRHRRGASSSGPSSRRWRRHPRAATRRASTVVTPQILIQSAMAGGDPATPRVAASPREGEAIYGPQQAQHAKHAARHASRCRSALDRSTCQRTRRHTACIRSCSAVYTCLPCTRACRSASPDSGYHKPPQ